MPHATWNKKDDNIMLALVSIRSQFWDVITKVRRTKLVTFNYEGLQTQQCQGSMGLSRSSSADVVQRKQLSRRGKLVATLNWYWRGSIFHNTWLYAYPNHKEDAGTTPHYDKYQHNHTTVLQKTNQTYKSCNRGNSRENFKWNMPDKIEVFSSYLL